MSGLRIILVSLLAVTLFGQTAQNAVPNPGALIDHAVQGIARNSLVASNLVASFRPFQPPAPPASATKCAVSLLEVPIAPDKNFVITEVNPPKELPTI
jgi:hypothetical protein